MSASRKLLQEVFQILVTEARMHWIAMVYLIAWVPRIDERDYLCFLGCSALARWPPFAGSPSDDHFIRGSCLAVFKTIFGGMASNSHNVLMTHATHIKAHRIAACLHRDPR